MTTITVVKTDSSGNVISEFTFPAGNDGQAAAAAVDPSGNLWIAGSIAVSSQSYPTLGLIAKLDSTGTQLLYSGTFGGLDPNGATAISAIAFDPAGNLYLAGSTSQTDFPVTPGAFITALITAPAYVPNGFVAKLIRASQSTPPYSLAYSTLLGGQPSSSSVAPTFILALAVDSKGVATVAGYTYASDFPVTSGAFQTQFEGGVNDADGFITRLNAQATSLIWSTLLGEGAPGAIALDSSGNVVVAGTIYDSSFPITPGAIQPQLAQTTFNIIDGFVTKLNSTGASLLFSTFYGNVNATPKHRARAGCEERQTWAPTWRPSIVVTGVLYSSGYPVLWCACRPRVQRSLTAPAQNAQPGFAPKMTVSCAGLCLRPPSGRNCASVPGAARHGSPCGPRKSRRLRSCAGPILPMRAGSRISTARPPCVPTA